MKISLYLVKNMLEYPMGHVVQKLRVLIRKQKIKNGRNSDRNIIREDKKG